jgi:hypothetical protein
MQRARWGNLPPLPKEAVKDKSAIGGFFKRDSLVAFAYGDSEEEVEEVEEKEEVDWVELEAEMEAMADEMDRAPVANAALNPAPAVNANPAPDVVMGAVMDAEMEAAFLVAMEAEEAAMEAEEAANAVPAPAEPNFPMPVQHANDRPRKTRKGGKAESKKPASPNQVLTPRVVVDTVKNEWLKVDGGKVFCTACNKTLCPNGPLKTSTVKGHVMLSKTHTDAVTKKLLKAVHAPTVASYAVPQPGAAGSKIDKVTHMRRFEVAEAHLRAGLPFSKFDDVHWRDSVQGNGPLLAGSRTMKDYIPQILEMEIKRLEVWVKGLNSKVSGEYDGSCVMHDAFAFLLRGLSEDELGVEQNLVDLRFFGKPITGETLAGYLTTTTAKFVPDRDDMLGWSHDRYWLTASARTHTPPHSKQHTTHNTQHTTHSTSHHTDIHTHTHMHTHTHTHTHTAHTHTAGAA